MMWLIISLLAAAYCIARSIADLRARRFVWGALGVAAGGALLIFVPIPTHAVKVDLGRATGPAATVR
jgi:hypothetical protein